MNGKLACLFPLGPFLEFKPSIHNFSWSWKLFASLSILISCSEIAHSWFLQVPRDFLLQILGEERVTNFVILEIVTSSVANYVKKAIHFTYLAIFALLAIIQLKWILSFFFQNRKIWMWRTTKLPLSKSQKNSRSCSHLEMLLDLMLF